MKKLFLTALMALGFLCTAFAQDVVMFNIINADGTNHGYPIDENTKIYFSDTQLLIYGPDLGPNPYPYDLASIKKAYFSTWDNSQEIENQQFNIYPNPANDVLHIVGTQDHASVNVFSIDGKIVKKIEIDDNAEINISDLQPGLYIIGVGNEFSKFIKM